MKEICRKFKIIVVSLLISIHLSMAWGTVKNPADVVKKIHKIADHSHAVVAVTAIHIETNKRISYNGNLPFFMASTVKVPIAIVMLQRIDQKQDQLDRLIKFKESNAVPGSGTLCEELRHQPHCCELSIKQLLALMLETSDNTATDLILKEVKGPTTVSKRLQQLGFARISVNRSIYDLYMATSGLPNAIRFNSIEELQQALCQVKPEKKIYAWKRFQDDKRDTTTSNEMAVLLSRVYKGKILSTHSTNLLLTIMNRCQTGAKRIKGLLPSCVKVAHKTGTWTESFTNNPGSKALYRYASDVGIITLPNQRGHIAVAIYVKSKSSVDIGREHAIARVAREVYDYFNMSPLPSKNLRQLPSPACRHSLRTHLPKPIA